MKQFVLMLLLLLPVQSVEAVTIGKNFDHFETNFILNGAHQRIRCGICHNRGQFKGTPTLCTGCHGVSSSIAVSKLSFAHIKSNEACDNCHTEKRWTGARVDHNSIDGSCFNCHNTRNAKGKRSSHVSSSNLCEDCHRTVAWRPARFTHDNVSQACANCHNTVIARGKNSLHIQTTTACDSCHSTNGWRPAKFIHENIVNNCNSCHNRTRARGIPLTGHVQTTSGCETCHTTRAWKPATFVHDSATGNCSNCHNGSVASKQSSGHFSTTKQCNDCHTVRGWKPARFVHGINYPNHGSRLKCIKCHKTNNQTIQWRDQSLSPDCAGCHRNKYTPKEHKNASVVALKDCAGTCHKSKPEHSARDSGWD